MVSEGGKTFVYSKAGQKTFNPQLSIVYIPLDIHAGHTHAAPKPVHANLSWCEWIKAVGFMALGREGRGSGDGGDTFHIPARSGQRFRTGFVLLPLNS